MQARTFAMADSDATEEETPKLVDFNSELSCENSESDYASPERRRSRAKKIKDKPQKTHPSAKAVQSAKAAQSLQKSK